MKRVALLHLTGCAAAAIMPTKEIVSGVAMPVVSIGTWTSGSTTKPEHAKDIVGSWLAQGYRGIDTALVYFNQAETAEAIAEAGVPREELFITSKIPGCEPFTAAGAVDYDLSQLNTSYIDLLLIHTKGGLSGACAKTWKVLERYVNEGKLRAIGVSNFDPPALGEVQKVATLPIAVNQIDYNVFSHNEETIEFCDKHGITVEAYSPLNGAHGGKSVFQDKTVLSIAAAHKVSAAQVALRWIAQRGHTLAVLTGDPKHQATDADIWSFQLEPHEMEALTELQNAQVERTRGFQVRWMLLGGTIAAVLMLVALFAVQVARCRKSNALQADKGLGCSLQVVDA